MRLDVFLVDHSNAKSRGHAKELIDGGFVLVNGQPAKKPASDVSETDVVEITAPSPKYVSRGGLKLEAAIASFNIDVRGKICCDVGSSTGGFTDCLLQNGAARVYAVDSGTNQLDPSLKHDPRVISIEQFNARELRPETLGEFCDVVTVDVSFISQSYIIENAVSILKNEGIYLGLIKPQFECGRAGLGKKGIVKDEKIRSDAVSRVISCAEEKGLTIVSVIESPIRGGDGNTEYLFFGIKKDRAVIGCRQPERW